MKITFKDIICQSLRNNHIQRILNDFGIITHDRDPHDIIEDVAVVWKILKKEEQGIAIKYYLAQALVGIRHKYKFVLLMDMYTRENKEEQNEY